MRRLVLLAALCGLMCVPSQALAVGVPASWDRGVNFTSWWHDQYASRSAEDSLAAAQHHTKANAVAVMATLHQATPTANTMAPSATGTPTDDALRTIIQRARARGMKVLLRPLTHVDNGASLADLAPTSPDTWFANYRAHIYRYAELAQATGVETFSVGAELRPMTLPRYSAQWRELIAGVRARFKGTLTYGAVSYEVKHIDFWDALDYIGVDAYYTLSRGPLDSEDEITARWSAWQTDGYSVSYVGELAAAAARWNKPVVFTEVGFTSTVDNLSRPWLPGTGAYDAQAQVRALNATFRAFVDKPWFRGMYVWQWHSDPKRGGPGDTDHIINNKPAQDTVGQWFGATSTQAPTATPAPAPASAPAQAQRAPVRRARVTLRVRRLASASAARKRRGYGVLGRVRGARRGFVRVEASLRSRGRWRVVRTVRTRVRSDGSYTTRLWLGRGRTHRIRARLAGQGRRRPAVSRARFVRA